MTNTLAIAVLSLSVVIDAICAWAIARKDKQTEFILTQAKEERDRLTAEHAKERERLTLALISKQTAVAEIIDDTDYVANFEKHARETNFFPELQVVDVDGKPV